MKSPDLSKVKALDDCLDSLYMTLFSGLESLMGRVTEELSTLIGRCEFTAYVINIYNQF